MRDVVTERATDTVESLVLGHLPLARHLVAAVAGRLPRHVNLDELTSAALYGLTQAARSFEPERGVPFAPHATLRIRGAILDELRGMDWASRSVRRQAREIDDASDRLAGELRRAATPAEVAEELGLRPEDVAAVRAGVQRAQLVHYEGLGTSEPGEHVLPADLRSPDQVVLDRERNAELREAIEALPDRLRLVVQAYYFDERPMQELAEELGVTTSRISQMRNQAVVAIGRTLRHGVDDECVEGGMMTPAG